MGGGGEVGFVNEPFTWEDEKVQDNNNRGGGRKIGTLLRHLIVVSERNRHSIKEIRVYTIRGRGGGSLGFRNDKGI